MVHVTQTLFSFFMTHFLSHLFWRWGWGERNTSRPPLSWQRKTQVGVGFTLFSSLQRLTLLLKGILATSEYFCRRTKGDWAQFATWIIFAPQIPFFCAGKGGYFEPFGFKRSSDGQKCANSPQEHNLARTTSRLGPRLWERTRQLISLCSSPQQSLTDNIEISPFLWFKPPLQEKYANVILGSRVGG